MNKKQNKETKTEVLQIRLTKHEKQTLMDKAKSSGSSVANLIIKNTINKK